MLMFPCNTYLVPDNVLGPLVLVHFVCRQVWQRPCQGATQEGGQAERQQEAARGEPQLRADERPELEPRLHPRPGGVGLFGCSFAVG